MDYIVDLWYLLTILCAGGATIGAMLLLWRIAEWAADEWRRFRRGCRRRARMRERARRAHTSDRRLPVRSPFVSRRARYLLQHRERVQVYRAVAKKKAAVWRA